MSVCPYVLTFRSTPLSLLNDEIKQFGPVGIEGRVNTSEGEGIIMKESLEILSNKHVRVSNLAFLLVAVCCYFLELISVFLALLRQYC